MNAIIAAITFALRSVLGFGLAVLSWPLRLFGRGASSHGYVPPEVAPPQVIPTAPAPDYTEMYRQVAVALQTWAAESLLADERLPVPTVWPRAVKEWAAGLDREECFAIIDAPEHAVIGHISGVFAMPRVRSLQPLAPAAWPRQEPMTITDPCLGHPGFFIAAAGERA